jgi:ketosteroid isomerase-like protein
VTPTAADLARAYLTALQAKDKDGILAILAEDFVLEVPFDVQGANDASQNWSGLEAAAANYEAAFREIEDLVYRDLDVTPAADGTVAFVETVGDMQMANGRPYKNRYIFRFDVRDGKIRRIREYLNPITGAVSFGIPLPVVEGSSSAFEQ